jgi:hypothetical protein
VSGCKGIIHFSACFSLNFVSMLIQEEQKRAQAAIQEIEAKGGLKRQTKGGKKVRILALP